MSALLDELRSLGLPMVSAYPPQTFTTTDEGTGEETTVTRQLRMCWTRDETKAERAREAGATVTAYRASDPTFSGWEVSVHEIV